MPRCLFSVSEAFWTKTSREQTKALHGRLQDCTEYKRLWKERERKEGIHKVEFGIPNLLPVIWMFAYLFACGVS